MLTATSEATLQDDIASGNVLVDFWAPWCAPCRAVHPVLEAIDEEKDDLTIISLNIDEAPAAAARFGVQSIPTMILFKDGKETARLIGAQPKHALQAELDRHLRSAT